MSVSEFILTYMDAGLATVLVGFLTFFMLDDHPETAKFLTAEERESFVTEIMSVLIHGSVQERTLLMVL